MSNKRVVVLTDDEIRALQGKAEKWAFTITAIAKLKAALEHPGGITDDMIARAKDAYNHTLVSADPWRAALEAALFPGDGEQ